MENFRLFFLVIVFAFAKTGEAQSTSFLINCGTNSSVTVNGRKWIGDLAPNSNITLSSTGIAASTDISSVDDSTYGELYKTARIFDSSLNYTVQGVRGDYFVRLHFSPLSFGDYNVNESSFGVEANGLKLVEKFEVPGEISQKNTYLQSSGSNSTSSIVKEYILAINRDVLIIEFIPAKEKFGFINAIEIVSAVDKLFAGSASKEGGNGENVNVSWQGIETMYRLNVGGSDLWRKWEVDHSKCRAFRRILDCTGMSVHRMTWSHHRRH